MARFNDLELWRTAVYPFQSTLTHLQTPEGKFGTIVRILTLTLTDLSKLHKLTKRVSYEGRRREYSVLCTATCYIRENSVKIYLNEG